MDMLPVKEIKWTWWCWQVLVDIIVNEFSFSFSFILNKEFKYREKKESKKVISPSLLKQRSRLISLIHAW